VELRAVKTPFADACSSRAVRPSVHLTPAHRNKNTDDLLEAPHAAQIAPSASSHIEKVWIQHFILWNLSIQIVFPSLSVRVLRYQFLRFVPLVH